MLKRVGQYSSIRDEVEKIKGTVTRRFTNNLENGIKNEVVSLMNEKNSKKKRTT